MIVDVSALHSYFLIQYCISSEPVNRICTVHVKGCFFRYIILLVQLNNFSTGNRSCFINYNVACFLQVMYAGMRLTHTLTCLILGRRLFRSMAEIVQAQVCFLFFLLLSVVCCCCFFVLELMGLVLRTYSILLLILIVCMSSRSRIRWLTP